MQLTWLSPILKLVSGGMVGKKFSRKLRVFSGIVRMVQQTKVSLCDDAQGSARRPYEISESPKLRERKINTTQNNQIERNQLFQRLNRSLKINHRRSI